MAYKNYTKRLPGMILLFIFSISVFATVPLASPCGGPTDLLSFIDRPTVGDSACVAPYKTVILESGYQYQKLQDSGSQQNFSNSMLRLGLADRYEINILLPNYIHQTVQPYTGFNAITLVIKHELGTSDKGVIAIEGAVVLPSGSATFGSRKEGGIFNGLFSYNITSQINVSGMLGVSSQSESIINEGQRFWSVNPDLVLAWSNNKISIYGEVNGQSKTGPQISSGFNMDAGILYLIKKNIVIDFEIGHRISGDLSGFNHYLGAGITFQFT